MKPGDEAILLALVRVHVSANADPHAFWPDIVFLAGQRDDRELNAAYLADAALEGAGFYWARTKRARLAAIDRAIIEAEALEDMGASEVLP